MTQTQALERRRASSHPFSGAGALLRLAARRDRFLVPAVVVGAAAVSGFSARATEALYPDEASLVGAAETFNSTFVLIALYGRVYDPTSLGALALAKLIVFWAALIACFIGWLVVRHSRGEEEAGRLELLGAGSVGRLAALGAAVSWAATTSLVLGGVVAAALVVGGLPVAGSVAFGAMWAMVGLTFCGVAALTAQLTTSARLATGLLAAVVLGCYLLRVLGDRSFPPGPAMWLTPLGWGQQVRPFAGDNPWPLLLLIGAAALLLAVAFRLQSNRDLGAALLRERTASGQPDRVTGPFAVAWRLQRGSLAWWLLGAIAIGSVLGGVAGSITGLLDNPQVADLIAQLGGTTVLLDGYLTASLGMLALVAGAYGVSAADRLFSEEAAGRADLLLSVRLGRREFACSHLAFAFGGTVALMMGAAVATGLAADAVLPEGGQLGRVLVLATVHIPAALTLPALVMFGFGRLPRLTGIGWVALIVFAVVGQVGRLIGLPRWLLGLSPFTHAPTPGQPLEPLPALVILLVVAVLTWLGLRAWRARDLR